MTEKANDGRAMPADSNRSRVAGVYIRQSSGNETDSTGLETQEEQCQAFAAKLGYRVKLYKEGIKSGASMQGRPQMARLLADIGAGRITTAIAYRWSRISRDAYDGLHIWLTSRRHGCTWRFVHSPVPSGMEENDYAIMAYVMESINAGAERKNIMGQTGDGAEKRLLRGGRKNGPKPPYGRERVDAGDRTDRQADLAGDLLDPAGPLQKDVILSNSYW
jgi:DNA invertase Pin-like site-specific DNA recombinase